MKNTLLSFLFSVATVTAFAQVGIGTPTPSAELDIITTNTGIPALELNPQTGPVGTQTGQLAVIGDKLYMFDRDRSKWLSIESSTLSFSNDGNTDNEYLQYGGNLVSNNSGAAMPLAGTIVYVAATSSGGDSDREFLINVRNSGGAVSSTSFSLVSNEFTDETLNVNFSAGDYINVFCQNEGGNVQNPAVTIWIKWRQ